MTQISPQAGSTQGAPAAGDHEPGTRRLLVNADDFGWSKSVNSGIVEAHLSGIVTSTSLLAAGHDFEHAVESLKQAPALKVGVHLNIYRGTPILPAEQVSSLLSPDGRFPGNWRITVARLVSGRIDLSQVEDEFCASVEKVLAAGIVPAHLDSEKHLHHWPSIFDVVCRVAQRYDIPRVRVVREPGSARLIPQGLTSLGRRDARVARTSGLAVADATVGVSELPTSAEVLHRLLASAPRNANTVEFVCHPGHVDEEFMAIQRQVSNRMVETRELEFATLADPSARQMVGEAGYELCSAL